MSIGDDLFFISMAARAARHASADAAQVRAAGPGAADPDGRQHARLLARRARAAAADQALVDEAGVNLAGVQRLLSIAEVVQRMRPLAARRCAVAAVAGCAELSDEAATV